MGQTAPARENALVGCCRRIEGCRVTSSRIAGKRYAVALILERKRDGNQAEFANGNDIGAIPLPFRGRAHGWGRIAHWRGRSPLWFFVRSPRNPCLALRWGGLALWRGRSPLGWGGAAQRFFVPPPRNPCRPHWRGGTAHPRGNTRKRWAMTPLWRGRPENGRGEAENRRAAPRRRGGGAAIPWARAATSRGEGKFARTEGDGMKRAPALRYPLHPNWRPEP